MEQIRVAEPSLGDEQKEIKGWTLSGLLPPENGYLLHFAAVTGRDLCTHQSDQTFSWPCYKHC